MKSTAEFAADQTSLRDRLLLVEDEYHNRNYNIALYHLRKYWEARNDGRPEPYFSSSNNPQDGDDIAKAFACIIELNI